MSKRTEEGNVQATVQQRRRRYDWDKWIDGKQHTAVQGEDFDCGAQSFVAALHYQAKARRCEKVVTSTNEEQTAVTFQFILEA